MKKEVYIDEKVLKNIEKKGLLKQYEKVEQYLKNGNFNQITLRLREPKKDRIYYFKINKQFRLWCKIEKNNIFIFHLDNHQ